MAFTKLPDHDFILISQSTLKRDELESTKSDLRALGLTTMLWLSARFLEALYPRVHDMMEGWRKSPNDFLLMRSGAEQYAFEPNKSYRIPETGGVLNNVSLVLALNFKNPDFRALFFANNFTTTSSRIYEYGQLVIIKRPYESQSKYFTDDEEEVLSELIDIYCGEGSFGCRNSDLKNFLSRYSVEVFSEEEYAELLLPVAKTASCNNESTTKSDQESKNKKPLPSSDQSAKQAQNPQEVNKAATSKQDVTKYEVSVQDFGDNKIAVIKVIRELTSKGLKEAKELVEKTPAIIISTNDKQEAERAKAQLVQAGALALIAENGWLDITHNPYEPAPTPNVFMPVPKAYINSLREQGKRKAFIYRNVGWMPNYIGKENMPCDCASLDSEVAYHIKQGQIKANAVKMENVGHGDLAITSILVNGFPNKSITGNNAHDRFITQAALFLYNSETGVEPLSKSILSGADTNKLLPHINTIVAEAKRISKKQKYWEGKDGAKEPVPEIVKDAKGQRYLSWLYAPIGTSEPTIVKLEKLAD